MFNHSQIMGKITSKRSGPNHVVIKHISACLSKGMCVKCERIFYCLPPLLLVPNWPCWFSHIKCMKVNKIILFLKLNFKTHLRKLEKAAIVAFVEMPISAKAKLNTRKLLGVRKSRILRKAITVTAFMKNPRRPLEHMREQIVSSEKFSWTVTQHIGSTLNRTMVVRLNVTSKASFKKNHHHHQIINIVSYPPQADMIPMQKHQAQRIPPAEEKKEPYWIFLI